MPSPINDLLILSNTNSRQLLLKPPKINLNVSKNNYAYKAAVTWNKIIPLILVNPEINTELGYIIPGSCKYSDLTTPIGLVKQKAKIILLDIQKTGDPTNWMSDGSNFTL